MDKIKKSIRVLGILLMSFIGGFVSQMIFIPYSLNASSQVVNADRLLILDPSGQVKGDWVAPNENGAMLMIYGYDGKMRMQLATYSESGERGLPMIGLSDNSGNLRMLFRLAGTNESPVMIFKDKQHRDRIVFGLDLNDKNEEPFLAAFDKDGNKKMLLGSY